PVFGGRHETLSAVGNLRRTLPPAPAHDGIGELRPRRLLVAAAQQSRVNTLRPREQSNHAPPLGVDGSDNVLKACSFCGRPPPGKLRKLAVELAHDALG